MFYLLVIILSVLATFLAKLNADLAAAQNELATLKAKAASLGYKI